MKKTKWHKYPTHPLYNRVCSHCCCPAWATDDWTLTDWPDGAVLCTDCSDLRQLEDDWLELERAAAREEKAS